MAYESGIAMAHEVEMYCAHLSARYPRRLENTGSLLSTRSGLCDRLGGRRSSCIGRRRFHGSDDPLSRDSVQAIAHHSTAGQKPIAFVTRLGVMGTPGYKRFEHCPEAFAERGE